MLVALTDPLLAFSHLWVIVLITLFGACLLDLNIFIKAAQLATMSMVVNVTLKGLFKIPLNDSIGTLGYAFPSGHMQLSTAFYLMLALSIPVLSWRITVAFLLVGIGASLIHHHYHTIQDVIAGFLCGLILVALYQYAWRQFPKKIGWLLFIIASILMIYNQFLYEAFAPGCEGYYFLCALLILKPTFRS